MKLGKALVKPSGRGKYGNFCFEERWGEVYLDGKLNTFIHLGKDELFMSIGGSLILLSTINVSYEEVEVIEFRQEVPKD